VRRLIVHSFTTALFLTSACSFSKNLPETSATIFFGAQLIVGDGSAAISDAAFVIEDGRFAAVGRTGQLEIPANAVEVNLAGKTVMPTIIDAHRHALVDREALIAELQELAYYGVGVAASLGHDAGDLAFQVQEETLPNAARLLTAGRGITSPEPGSWDVPYWVTTEEEARTAVRELAERRVDLVKIWVDDRNGKYEKLSPALYSAIIDEAHSRDLLVAAHIFALEDAKGLLRAGIDAFAHGIRDVDVDHEVLALFRERPNVVLIPNLANRGVAVDMSWICDTVSADEVVRIEAEFVDQPGAQERFDIQARNLVRLHEAGVRLAFGTDGGPPWAAHVELEDMVAAGMTPAEVIVAATRNSAELLRLEDVGTLEPGKSADFIVLNSNPLDDITNTRRIDAVYLRGIEVDREAIRIRAKADDNGVK
jgi:imidazolonepropionase-like amidohydrolase